MCGISGIIKFGKGPGINVSIRVLNDLIGHRGPDDEGFALFSDELSVPAYGKDTPQIVINGGASYNPSQNIENIQGEFNLALGHRRLAIIETGPSGHQPMCDTAGELWITYNGEIYNYKELRSQLISAGEKFQTGSDTEVILSAYKKWGFNCVDRFDGMWSFVIYDLKNNLIFGSRDRFGVKPFYYYQDKEIFAFCSEQKALIRSGIAKTGIRKEAVYDFFLMSLIEDEEESFFQNIYELFPSHSFTLDLKTGQFKKWKYYNLSPGKSEHNSEEAIIEHTKKLLLDSVAFRMRSDVPVGSCLSGGLDSSAIVGMMDHLLKKTGKGQEINVYSAIFPGNDIDESKWAKKVVTSTHTHWHTVTPDPKSLINDIRDLIYCQDVPIWSTSTYAQFRVMKMVKESGIKVILDGQGGDELFGGYHTYYTNYWAQLLKQGKPVKFLDELFNYPSGTFFFRQYLKQMILPVFGPGIKNDLYLKLYPEFRYLSRPMLEQMKHRLNKNKSEPSDLNQQLLREFDGQRLKVYLKCEDRCSMWHSVEARTPFADDRKLIEYIFSQPASLKIKKGVNKYLLRESMREFVPREIIERKDKMGYVTPNNEWISKIKEEVRSYFTEDLDEFIDTKKILRDYNKLFTPVTKTDTGRLFKFMSFAIWKNIFFGRA